MANSKQKRKDKNLQKRDSYTVEKHHNALTTMQHQEIPIDTADKEQRRTTRLGAIIAIVAVIATLFTLLFKLTTNTLNIWSEHGSMYWYLQALFSIALAIVGIIFFDIVIYLVSDLRRYNTLDHNYKQYDQVSDEKYMRLFDDFIIYTIMLFGVIALDIPLTVIYGEASQKLGGIIVSCICVIAGIYCFVQWVKKRNKEEIKQTFLKVGEKVLNCAFGALFCFALGLIIVANNKSTIQVEYNEDGIVEIYNASAEGYKEMNIEICNMDDEVIYTKSVEREELLFAREDKYVINEIDGERIVQGMAINADLLHWKYVFDIGEIANDSGEYYISITSYQNGKKAVLINSFFADNKKYIYAKDSIEKTY